MGNKELAVIELAGLAGELITPENVISKNVGDEFKKIVRARKELEKVEKRFKDALFSEMKAKGIRKIKANGITISVGDDTTREKFNEEKFKHEHPKIYEKYIEITKVKGKSLVIVKDENDE